MHARWTAVVALALTLSPSSVSASPERDGAGTEETHAASRGRDQETEDLQALLDRVEDGGAVRLEARRYTTEVGFELRDKSDVIVLGVEGTELVCTSPDADVFRVEGGSGIRLFRLRMFHSLDRQGAGSGAVISAVETAGLSVERCDLGGGSATGIRASGVDPLGVTESAIHDCQDEAFAFVSCGTVRLLHNRIENNGGVMLGDPRVLWVTDNARDGESWDLPAPLVHEPEASSEQPKGSPAVDELQALLDQAEDGAHIVLEAKRYTTDVGFELVDKTNVTVEGVPGTELACTSQTNEVFRVQGGSGITLRGLHMFHTVKIAGGCTGDVLACEETRDLAVEDCDLNGCGVTGLSTWRTFGVRATGNLIHDNSHAGFSFFQSGKVELRDNRLEANGQAMADVPGWLVVEGNTVDGEAWDPRPEPIDRPEDVGPRTPVQASWDGASVSKEDRTRALAGLEEAEEAWRREGDLAGMVPTLRDAVALNPELGRAQELLLRALWHAQAPLEERLATAERALAVFPKNPRLLYFYAKGLFEGGYLADAARECEAATSLLGKEFNAELDEGTTGSFADRGEADAYFLRAELELALGRFDSADSWFSMAQTFGELRQNSWSAVEADIPDVAERATQRREQLEVVLAYRAADEYAAKLARASWETKLVQAAELRRQGRFEEARALATELAQEDAEDHEAEWMLVGLALDEWNLSEAEDLLAELTRAADGNARPRTLLEEWNRPRPKLQQRHLQGFAVVLERDGYGRFVEQPGVGAGAPAWWAPEQCRMGIYPDGGVPVHDPDDRSTQELRRAFDDGDQDRVKELATRLLARDPFHPDARFAQAAILSKGTGGPAEKYARWAERAKESLWLESPDAWRRAHTLNLIGELLTRSMRDGDGTWSDEVGTRALEYLLAGRDALLAIVKEPSGTFYRSALYDARGLEDAPLVLELLDDAEAQGASLTDPAGLRRWAEERLRVLAPAAEAEER